MEEDESVEARMNRLETVAVSLFETIERNRFEIAALRTLIATVVDDSRPDDALQADQWLGRLYFVATTNTDIYADAAREGIINSIGPDPDMLDTVERERKAVKQTLNDLFQALKRPDGSVG